MSEGSSVKLRARKGRGKMVLGFLTYQMGITLLIDTSYFNFCVGMIVFGVLLHLFGIIQNFFVNRWQNKGKFNHYSSTKKPMASTAAIIFSILSLSLASLAQAALPPMDQIKDIDQRLKGYHKGETLTPEQEKQNRTIKNQVLKKDFDLREMCRLALGKQWNSLNADQRNQFVELFTQLLLNNAVLHSEKHTGQEKIEYIQVEDIEDFKGRKKVDTLVKVPTEAVDFDVSYAMVYDQKLGRWRIYDLIIDEESLMLNYRDQFQMIIREHSYNYLVEKMQKKLAESSQKKQKKSSHSSQL